MKRSMKNTSALLKAQNRYSLLNTLCHKRASLNAVRDTCNQLCNGLPNRKNKSQEISGTIMRWKKNDAKYQMQKITQQNSKDWRDIYEYLNTHGATVNKEYHEVWKTERSKMDSKIKQKNETKIQHLCKKDKGKTLNEVEQIIVKDQQLDENFDSSARTYGGVTLSTNEQHLLRLPPKFAIYNKIDIKDCEVEIEAGLTKIRWNRRNQNENPRDKNTESTVTSVIPMRKEKIITGLQSEIDAKDNGPEERSRPVEIAPDGHTVLDMGHLRPTDLPFNKRVFLPQPLDKEEETKLQKCKIELISAAQNYIESKKRNTTTTNLTMAEINGLKEIKRREECVISVTDKSGRFTVDSVNNYEKTGETHCNRDENISTEDHLKAQKEMNAHSTMWLRILKASSHCGANGESRTRANMMVENSSVAALHTLRKDHKAAQDPEEGPATRPVCGANAAYNRKLAHLISTIIRPVWMNGESVCCSSEEMMAAIHTLNGRNSNEELIVGSADVKALYPSLDIEHTAEIVATLFHGSTVEINNIDSEELGLYLALNMNQTSLESENIEDFCPTRKSEKGRPPTITGCAIENDVKARYKPWKSRKRTPKENEVRRMFSIALMIVIKQIMNNHIYHFGDKMKKQIQGGPIGLELTGDLAQIYMMWYDNQLKTKAKEENIDILLYQRYVDDINMVIAKPPSAENNENKTRIDDLEIMNNVKSLGNSIHPSIQLEIDVPSQYPDNKLPILDMKVWCGTKKDNARGSEKHIVLHEFYSKPMANKSVIHARSAMPNRMKKTILTQEMLRTLLRCSPELDWSVFAKHGSELNRRMQYSGYSHQFRTIVTQSAINAYQKIKERDDKGQEPMYRPRSWERKSRMEQKRRKRDNWFKNKGEESVIFVPATPNSELRNEYERIVKQNKVKIRIEERVGVQLQRVLRKPRAFRGEECRCLVCISQGPGKCDREGVLYEIRCKKCNDTYVGETARTACTRISEHLKSTESKTTDSAVQRHHQERHRNDEEMAFSARVLRVYGGDALRRQIGEGVFIRHQDPQKIINQKSEWNDNSRKIPHLQLRNSSSVRLQMRGSTSAQNKI